MMMDIEEIDDNFFNTPNDGQLKDIPEELYNISSVKIIQSPDEFLNYMTAKFFYDQDKIMEIKSILNSGKLKRIGDPSAVGESYASDNYVVKVSKYCPSGGKVVNIVQKLCKVANEGDIIFRIPDSLNNKFISLVPNYLSETVIGILLDKLKNYTPSFVKTFGALYDYRSSEKVVYTFMEKLEPLTKYITTPEDFLFIYFELFQGLDTAQRLTKFTHYDLHPGNFLVRKEPNGQNTLKIFPLSNGNYFYAFTNYNAVIIDFGFSRMETKDNAIIPKVIFQNASNQEEILNYFSFSPYYDTAALSFAGDAILKKLASVNTPLDTIETINNILYVILSKFFNTPGEENIVREKFNKLRYNNWRPYPKMLQDYGFDEYRLSTTSEMISFILDSFSGHISDFKDTKSMTDYITQNRFMVYNSLVDLSDYFKNIQLFEKIEPNMQLDTTFYPILTWEDDEILGPIKISHFNGNKLNNLFCTSIDLTLQNFDFSKTPNAISHNSMINQYIHVVEIPNQTNLIKGYEFRFDCCRVDSKNYFQTSKISSGVAINATFFDIKNTYKPIGDFQNKSFDNHSPIPHNYEDVYAGVVIDAYGLIDIVDLNLIYKFPQFMTCGPILVNDGKIIMTRDRIINQKDKNGKPIWACRSPKRGEETKNFFDDNLFNCTMIEPGQLYHASNSNPRSALIITSDQKVKFVYVEGRDKRGVGMRLDQLAELCICLKADRAIALDGGRSSDITWKTEGEDIIKICNPENKQAYPVGSVLSFVKFK